MEEFNSEEVDGFGAAGEDVMDDVIVSRTRWGRKRFLDELLGILDDSGVVVREVEVFIGEIVYNRVNLDNCRIDSVADQGARSGANAESTDICQFAVKDMIR